MKSGAYPAITGAKPVAAVKPKKKGKARQVMAAERAMQKDAAGKEMRLKAKKKGR